MEYLLRDGILLRLLALIFLLIIGVLCLKFSGSSSLRITIISSQILPEWFPQRYSEDFLNLDRETSGSVWVSPDCNMTILRYWLETKLNLEPEVQLAVPPSYWYPSDWQDKLQALYFYHLSRSQPPTENIKEKETSELHCKLHDNSYCWILREEDALIESRD